MHSRPNRMVFAVLGLGLAAGVGVVTALVAGTGHALGAALAVAEPAFRAPSLLAMALVPGAAQFACERLYLTADRTRVVPHGSPEAAFLYASEGDEIPASAAEKFGLVDGGVVAAEIAIDPPPNDGQGWGLDPELAPLLGHRPDPESQPQPVSAPGPAADISPPPPNDAGTVKLPKGWYVEEGTNVLVVDDAFDPAKKYRDFGVSKRAFEAHAQVRRANGEVLKDAPAADGKEAASDENKEADAEDDKQTPANENKGG
ncbi:hypothetical protein [Microcystis phage Mwe-Yong1]|nr:hypothetical protein [Microcystis phage Mwe-Yong1]